MSKILLVPGIRNRPWGENPMLPVSRLLTARGVPNQVLDYGYIAVPLTNARARRAIRNAFRPGDILGLYSNAAYAGAVEANDNPSIDIIVMISGALRADWTFAAHVRQVVNLYNPGDRVLALGGGWAWFWSWAPWRWRNGHGWGQLGRGKYAGSSDGVRDDRLPDHVGHSWYEDGRANEQAADWFERLWRERQQKQQAELAKLDAACRAMSPEPAA